MGRFIAFAIIYGIMLFIWSFVYLNRSHNKVNQAFLYFLSDVILWMVLSISNSYHDTPLLVIAVKTVYWFGMLNLAPLFLLFIYRFLEKRLDWLFYMLVGLNLLTIFSRYLFPIDYSDPTFWRLSNPVAAPVMSGIFSLPVIRALILIFRQYQTTRDVKLRRQLLYIFWGSGLACMVSVLSEYILPTRLHVDLKLSLMYVAILIFVVAIFISIMRYRMLNIQPEYIYRKLFLNSSNGIIIVGKDQKIISINHTAREILRCPAIDADDKMTDYIPEYRFEAVYSQEEIMIRDGDKERYLLLTQDPIDLTDQNSAKLLTITDETPAKLELRREKELLIEKTFEDQLTGLYNKQYLRDGCELCGEEQTKGNLILLFIDVDNFKSINDVYGHLAGDDVLKTLAGCIRRSIRKDARAVRFGGDEFIVLMTDISAQDAFQVAERIRNNANRLDFTRYDPKLKLSLSIGLVEGPPPVSDLIVKADRAMYHSKSVGKNRTTVFSETSI